VATADLTCGSPTTAIPQAHGRLTSSRANTNGLASTTTYSQYDFLGRISASQQVTNGSQPYLFTYGYDLADKMVQEAYPGGRVLTTVYDDVERPMSVTGVLNGTTTHYALGAS
jgi:hypothetical protein